MGLHKLFYNLHRACKFSVQKDSESDSSTSIPLASTRKQAIGKEIARAKRSLLKSTLLKVKILSTLVKSLSPRSKSPVLNNLRTSLRFKKQGRQQTLLSWFLFGTASHQLLCCRVKRHCLYGQSRWKKCFTAKALPILQHKGASGFVQ